VRKMIGKEVDAQNKMIKGHRVGAIGPKGKKSNDSEARMSFLVDGSQGSPAIEQ